MSDANIPWFEDMQLSGFELVMIDHHLRGDEIYIVHIVGHNGPYKNYTAYQLLSYHVMRRSRRPSA